MSIRPNNTTIYDVFSGARASNKSGKKWSHGTNINYSFSLSKKWFSTIGLGYFKQSFGVKRGFDFYEPNIVTRLFYTTKEYSYKTLHYFGGFGYSINLKKNIGKIFPLQTEIRLATIANFYNSTEQVFDNGGYHDPYYGNPQIRKSSYFYGSSIQVKGGILRPLSKKIKIGVDLIIPVYNKFRKDKIFKENVNEYHRVKFSIGSAINLIYKLKK